MPYYTLRDGQQCFVHEVGFGKDPVVLLHGLGMDGTTWIPFALPMLKDKKFYIPDFRGWGKSKNCDITEDYYFGQMADDVQNIIEKIGAPKVTLVGISMGACIGLEYLKRYGDEYISRYMHIDHPAHLDKEVNINVVPSSLVTTGEAMIKEARYFDPKTPFTKLPKSYQRKHFTLLYGVLKNSLKFPWQKAIAMSIEYNPIMRDFLSKNTPQGSWYPTLKFIQAAESGQFDVRKALKTISCPILNVVGTHDTLFPLNELQLVSELAQNAELVEFDNSGHLLMVTESPKFIKLFTTFLRNNEVAQGSGSGHYA